jgi:hypothetical protein
VALKPKAVWLQLGVRDDEAPARLQEGHGAAGKIVIGGPGLPDSTAVADVAGVHVAEDLVGLVHASA